MSLDLTVCDEEPIARLERIQSFGFLLALGRDWTVTRASANLEAMLGVHVDAALGAKLETLFHDEAMHDLRNRVLLLRLSGGNERIFGMQLVDNRGRFDVIVHLVDDMCVVEGEPTSSDDRVDAASMVRGFIARLNAQPTLDAFHGQAARQVRAITSFERVMIYRFAASGAGSVIAEVVRPDVESFLGLHFPASDIPVQARSLYLRNPFRIVADTNAATVPLISHPSDALDPLDLSLAITRAVSPVHIEYLRNMGVRASLSISIIVDGMLWGLIACHHTRPTLPSFVARSAAELFAQMYSMTLERRLRKSSDERSDVARSLVDGIVKTIAADTTLLADADWVQRHLQPLIPADSIAICTRGVISRSALAPAAAQSEAVVRRLIDSGTSGVFATEELSAWLGDAALTSGSPAGLLAIPISRRARDFILLFRDELIAEISWAGNPDKALVPSDDGSRLSPRKSFAAYTESVRGHSRPFTDGELAAAARIQSQLRELIVRLADDSHDSDETAVGRQDLMIAELNHRVRNVLSLIRGLISQTRGEAGDVESYVRSLDERVQALARAHNQLTRHTWGPGPLAAIFEGEISAYAPTSGERFLVDGPPIALHPQAYSTVALVIHELVTNSVKYGSLSDSGRVHVRFELRGGDGLYLQWRESGGPAVRSPLRRGFGSVIIERAIPFDLQGSIEIRYAPTGFEADIHIPAQHVADHLAPGGVALVVNSMPTAQKAQKPLDNMTVLLLEDNLIVALEAEDLLLALGAKYVHVASNIATATSILESSTLDFAVLDINLGKQTTLRFASFVQNAGIPFLFASGYGSVANLGALRAGTIVVAKPYDRDALGAAIATTLDAFRAAPPLH